MSRNSSGVRKRSRGVSRYWRTCRQGLHPGGDHLPALGQREHLREHPDRLVGRRRRIAQSVVEPRRVFRRDVLQRLAPQRRQDVALDGHAVVLRRPRLAARGDMVLQAECRQVGDGGLGRRFRLLRVLAPLDAVDGRRRLAAALLHSLLTGRPERRPLQACRSPRLDDVELAPGGVDPDPKAGEVAVPEDGVLAAGLEPVHNPLGQPEGAPFRHRRAPSRNARISVIKPHTDDIKSGAIEGDAWREVKGSDAGEDRKIPYITTLFHNRDTGRRAAAVIGNNSMRPRI